MSERLQKIAICAGPAAKVEYRSGWNGLQMRTYKRAKDRPPAPVPPVARLDGVQFADKVWMHVLTRVPSCGGRYGGSELFSI